MNTFNWQATFIKQQELDIIRKESIRSGSTVAENGGEAIQAILKSNAALGELDFLLIERQR